jgi:hypothetical protein
VLPASSQHQLLHAKKKIWKPKSPAEFRVPKAMEKEQTQNILGVTAGAMNATFDA